ncbi:glycoside hydrolase family 3 N-terminal domain-containing protein [Arthrobacter sp. 35W]|uniref:glycoside hydrolase family 3 N-terminal domain-containing protein n=1 Tax=Arthrobacter sp. 35W TaxID=1132441 RepID=UPI000404DF62|nr:glycoside hydrolase family 3 N-terminal domain-containing protein [Arthrobacter sp. 35W]
MVKATRRWWIAAAAVAVLLLVVVLGVNGSLFQGGSAASGSPSSDPTASSDPPSTSEPTTPPPPPPSAAQTALARLSLEQRVGQLFMVSSPVAGPDANTSAALADLSVGNVFMKGRTVDGAAAMAAVVAGLRGQVESAVPGVAPFVATDQEGGLVQIMKGPGFSIIPAAIEQGALDPAQLRADAQQWGSELASAGINVNLAPVMDTVPSAAFAPSNAPIGYFGREYGYTPEVVASHGTAFTLGMQAAGVQATVKHFPGLGRVEANTDVSSGVTDAVTVRNDPYIAPFRTAVDAGAGWLMVSNASYPAIDPTAMAPFSATIVTDMVRGDLGFKGVIVTDDICDAVQLSVVPLAERAAGFIAAGGTMALCTNQSMVAAMYQGVLDRAAADPAFAALVDKAALLVLEAKDARGLLAR